MRQRKRITISIETAGAAFDDHEGGEIAKQLRHIAKRFADDTPRDRRDNGVVLDTNGSICGLVTIETI
jgi:hypothetical protein